MGFQSTKKTIEDVLIAGWSTTPISFENTEVDPETLEDSGNEDEKKPWVQATLLNGDANNIEVGGGRRRHVGVLVLNLFAGPGQGTVVLHGYADTLKILFQNVTLTGGITFRVPSLRTLGVVKGWYQINLECPFYWDET